MATKLGSVVGYRSGIYNGYKVIGTQTLGLRGLVLWLKFNEGSGNIAYDSSFYNNHGTIYGATWTDGKFGKALSFDGVDDYVEVPNEDRLTYLTPITIAVWIYPTEFNIDNEIISSTYGAGGYELAIMNDGTKVKFQYHNGTQWRVSAFSYTFSTNKWYFIAVTYSANGGEMFINGESIGTFPYTGDIVNPPNTDSLFIGTCANPEYREWFNGTIDEVRIYNRALSENEIKMLYYNRIGAVPSKTI